ncbi:hypothetical protein CBR_g12584 [Chara braunii]|uniref:Uncharacterized protein n=1 Tax=Chara braunii TaxID=69332 RepID=A0A388KS15_CHABU|nr:hypothetical protein CBR_g12584 [Chara braunii]|eukprot:GBG72865.1 hypothetical protein CBR_g12584 [Chara braunii]
MVVDVLGVMNQHQADMSVSETGAGCCRRLRLIFMEGGSILQEVTRLQKDIDALDVQLEDEIRKTKLVEASLVLAEEQVCRQEEDIVKHVKLLARAESECNDQTTVLLLRQEEIARLEQKNRMKEQELSELRAALDQERRSFVDACCQFTKSQEDNGVGEAIRVLQECHATIIAEERNLTETLRNTEREKAIVDEKVKAMRKEGESMRERRQQLADHIACQRKKNEELQRKINELKKQEEENGKEEQQLITMALALDLMNEEEDELQISKDRLCAQLSGIQKEIEDLGRRIASQKEEIRKVDTQIEEHLTRLGPAGCSWYQCTSGLEPGGRCWLQSRSEVRSTNKPDDMKAWVTSTLGNSLKLITQKLEEVDSKSKLATTEKEELIRLRAEKAAMEKAEKVKKESSSEKRKRAVATPGAAVTPMECGAKPRSRRSSKARNRRVEISSDDEGGDEGVKQNLGKKMESSSDLSEVKKMLAALVQGLADHKGKQPVNVPGPEPEAEPEPEPEAEGDEGHDVAVNSAHGDEEEVDEGGLAAYMKVRQHFYASLHYTRVQELCKQKDIPYFRKEMGAWVLARLDLQAYVDQLKVHGVVKVGESSRRTAVQNGNNTDAEGDGTENMVVGN